VANVYSLSLPVVGVLKPVEDNREYNIYGKNVSKHVFLLNI
jgi:hypothetical protein